VTTTSSSGAAEQRLRGWWNPSAACGVLEVCGGALCSSWDWPERWRGAAWVEGAAVRRAKDAHRHWHHRINPSVVQSLRGTEDAVVLSERKHEQG
jgi:hypothetical protein